MKTDSQLLAIFQNNPDMLKELLGLDGEAPYRLKSEEFKNLARTADGVFDYDGAQIAYIIEFQGQKEPYIYHRAAMERIMYSQLHPEKRVYMVIVFLQEGFDPETEPWCGLSKAGNPYFRVLYLEDVLGDLAERDPDHPLQAVFQPYLIADDKKLKDEAATYYRTIRMAPIEERGKQALLRVFESWIAVRFTNLSKEELLKMLAVMGNLEDSVAYKELKEEGRTEGRIEGRTEGRIEGRIEGLKTAIENLEELLADGILSAAEFEKRMTPLKQKISELTSKHKK